MITLVLGDICDQEVDAICNAANSSLLGGGGVDGAIHRKGGPAILEECKSLRRTTHKDGLPTGEAVATTAGNLNADWVIHTVGPIYQYSADPAGELLKAYRSCIHVALELDKVGTVKSIAFPSISTGAYGYPIQDAAIVAMQALWPFPSLDTRIVLFSKPDHTVYSDVLDAFNRFRYKVRGGMKSTDLGKTTEIWSRLNQTPPDVCPLCLTKMAEVVPSLMGCGGCGYDYQIPKPGEHR
jgi:O-acetyl-ADP-ribose deacetylase (regulator of RNase III)